MKKFIIANWKMQLSIKESLELAKTFKTKIKNTKNDIVVCPDFLSLPFIGPVFNKTGIDLGAQNCALTEKGAYTGEVSVLNLKTLGAKYVIVGHSERRLHLHENSALINQKIKVALANKLIPILCIGEKIEEKEAGQTKRVLLDELKRALSGIKIKNSKDIIVAYEPLWAIGSGHFMIPVEAEIIHFFIKKEANKLLKKNISVIYGGSVDSKNAPLFLKQNNVDGFLIGGASLKADEFINICKN